MPISIDQFEAGELDSVGETNAERILRFLGAHEHQAFTRSEIAEETGVPANSVGPVLSRLEDRGLVRHRGSYWAVSDADTEEGSPDRATEDAGRTDSDAAETTHPHRVAARTAVDRIEARLGDAIDSCFVFGSVARGEETTSSDVDLLVVVADSADYRATDDELLEIAYDVQLEYDVPIEVHAMREAEFRDRKARGEPFVRSVLAEGERYV